MEWRVTTSLCVLFVVFHASQSFLLESQDLPDSKCIWYGNCGESGYNNGKLNCHYNDTAKLLDDASALEILKNYCPALYNGDENTYTCCNVDQLKGLKKSVSLATLLLKKCPACWFNFLNLICNVACSPYQSTFMWPDMNVVQPEDSERNGVPAVTMIVGEQFANGMFESCEEVSGLLGSTALGLICGRSEGCSPSILLNYMGTVDNGQAPFPIRYEVTNEPWTAPDGKILEPFNFRAVRCNTPPQYITPQFSDEVCRCQDCQYLSCDSDVEATDENRIKFYDDTFGANQYILAKLSIERVDSKALIEHEYPPPSVDKINFTSVFEKDFLHQVLTLQEEIANIATSEVTLDDVCVTVEGECVIQSITQYYQNNATTLDAQTWDKYDFYIMADYLDHFLACLHNPEAVLDGIASNGSCLTSFGSHINAYLLLNDYKYSDDSAAYETAQALEVTFVLQNTDEAKSWSTAFSAFMATYSNPSMAITFSST